MKNRTNRIGISAFVLFLLFAKGADLHLCDTRAALGDATARGLIILAKNSDRLLFDCQPFSLNSKGEITAMNLFQIYQLPSRKDKKKVSNFKL